MQRRTFVVLSALLASCGGASTPARTVVNVEFGSIDAALAGEHRSEANRARDRYRHPRETLAFFGIEPGMRVAELWPGGGWYTEVLAPLLHDDGQLTAVAAEGRFLQPYRDFLAAHPELYDRVEVATVTPPDNVSFGEEGAFDAVLTFRNFHNWVQGDFEDAVVQAAFRVLRPGGVFGVVEHRGDPALDREGIKRTGYVPEQFIIEAATRAGFVLEERSEINANPNDDHDHPEGVWTLPPVLRLGDQDREQYVAIGESDRMTLRFRKPE
jgi:predicted methyltransferase